MTLSYTKNNKFLVKMVENHDILNCKEWWPLHYKKNTISIESVRLKTKNEKEHLKSLNTMSLFILFYSEKEGAAVATEFVNGFKNDTFVLKKVWLHSMK